MHLDLERLAAVGEEEQRVHRAAMEDVLDLVLFLRLDAGDAPPAAMLRAVGVAGDALDVAGLGQRDDDIDIRDEVFLAEVAGRLGADFRAPLVAVALLEVLEVRLDDRRARAPGRARMSS